MLLTLGIGFYQLQYAWLALPLVLGLVLLYFLKLKRPRLAVPSLVLWRQVVNDNRVNSPFQRFKRNILLLLQLLLLLLLIIALMGPHKRGAEDTSDWLPILIDRSASMAAVDEHGKSRLDIAKQRVRDMIEGLNPDEDLAAKVAIIAFGSTARQYAPFTSDKRVLLDAIDKITIEDVPSDIGDALRMTDALARTHDFDRVLLISDGNIPAQVDFDLPFRLDYQQLPKAGANMGITELNARRGKGKKWSVFVNVEGSTDALYPASLELLQDGESRGSQHISPIPGRSQRLVFDIQAEEHTSVQVRLKPGARDSLKGDDAAYLELAPLRSLDVYVSPSLGSFAHGVRVMGDQVRVFPDKSGGKQTRYDLIITDKEDEPVGVAWQTRIGVGYIPQEIEHLIQSTQDSSTVIDWRRSSQLLEYVELSDVVVMQVPGYKTITRQSETGQRQDRATTADVENEHFEVTAFGRDGEGRECPLIVQKLEGDRRSYFILFDANRSTLPYRVGFPILIQNTIRAAMFHAGMLEVVADATGVLPSISVTGGRGYDVHGPDGFERNDAKPDEDGLLRGLPAPRAGRYVISGGKIKAQLAVSLLDSNETQLDSVDRISFNELSVTAVSNVAKTDRPMWFYFAVAGLCLLMVEWWFFQRKPGGFSRK